MKNFFKFNNLFWFYFCQGVPFGFFLNYMPLEMREQEWSLSYISFWTVVLGIPWACKFLWSPIVDTIYSSEMGRRRSWIFPLNSLMVLLLIGTSFASPKTDLYFLIFLLFLVNVASATQDIAVDGLTVSLLSSEERGLGNAIQVVGYKFGMLLAGNFVILVVIHCNWALSQLTMAVLLVPSLLLAYVMEEKVEDISEEKKTKEELFLALKKLFETPGMKLLILFIGTYKVGESMAGSKYNLMLKDYGYDKEAIIQLMVTYGLISSLLGSLFGGLALRYISRYKALIYFSLGQGFFILIMSYLATLNEIPTSTIKWVLAGENFLGGMVTTVLFTFMMDFASPEWGGTQYTLFATVEVLFKIIAWQFSAYLVEIFFGTKTNPDYFSMYIASFFFLLFPLILLRVLRKTTIYQQFVP